MESKKCPVCGGELKVTRPGVKMQCPFCNGEFELEEKKSDDKGIVFDKKMFHAEREFSGLDGKKNVSECLKSIMFYMREIGGSKEMIPQIKRLLTGSDKAAEGINEELITAARPRVEPQLSSGEKILFYFDRGIFFKGKEYVILTDKSFLFVSKKKLIKLPFADISTLKLSESGDIPMWYINSDYNKSIPSLGSPQLSGAVFAFACLSAFEAAPDRERIRLI